MKMFIAAGIAMALLTGCQGPKLNTPSGHQEATIAAPKAKVKDVLIEELLNEHYEVMTDTESTVVAEGNAGAWLGFWFSNAITLEAPKIRARFTIVESDGTTRLVGFMRMASAPGLSGRNSEMRADGRKSRAKMQVLLDAVKARSEVSTTASK